MPSRFHSVSSSPPLRSDCPKCFMPQFGFMTQPMPMTANPTRIVRSKMSFHTLVNPHTGEISLPAIYAELRPEFQIGETRPLHVLTVVDECYRDFSPTMMQELLRRRSRRQRGIDTLGHRWKLRWAFAIRLWLRPLEFWYFRFVVQLQRFAELDRSPARYFLSISCAIKF
jgi:hypothetical protein